MTYNQLNPGKYIFPIKSVVSFILILLFFSACSSTPYFYKKGEEGEHLQKVAVLPFRNVTDQRGAGKIITNLFVMELAASNHFQVEEMGNIREFFVRQRIRERGELGLDTLKMMGRQIKVEGIIMGMVHEYSRQIPGANESVPMVALSARMLDPETGEIIWKCRHERKGDDYLIALDWGRVRTANLLAQKVIKEMIATMR